MVTFVNLCEAYMAIEPHFNLWNYFCYARLWQGLGAKAEILGGADIFVRSGLKVDPHFHLPISRPLDRWWKVWFFMRNDTNALLPMFMGSRLIPQPNWGYGVARKDFRKLQPLREVIQQLLCRGLMDTDLFQRRGSSAPSAGDDHLDVSGAMLSRPSLLRGVG
jgi:hypothetical protein